MDGFIKLHRKFFENILWREPREYSRAEAWLDLIQSAKFDSTAMIINSRVVEIHRGEVAASRRYLEKRWGWGSTKVGNFLGMLRENQMVSTRQTSGQTIIILCNYEHYNASQPSRQTIDKPDANHRQTTDKPNIKKDKKDKKEKYIPPIPPAGESVIVDDFSFDKIWELYDKKIGDKERLRRKWDKLLVADKQAIVAYVPRYKTAQPNKQYRKNFDTFLNNKSWNDEIITEQSNDKPYPHIADTKRIGSAEKRTSTI